jgi:hypothetical protein
MTCKHEDGPKHDCDYVAWRESKIPTAEAMADAFHPMPEDASSGDIRMWQWRWDAAFLRAMATLTGDPLLAAGGA